MSPLATPSLEDIATTVVDCSYKIHTEVGPGLLETVYEASLARMLELKGFKVQRQLPVPIDIFDLHFDEGFRADLVINDHFIVELKSIEKLASVHYKQLLTYLRLRNNSLGLLINFGASTLKEGVKRVVNNHTP